MKRFLRALFYVAFWFAVYFFVAGLALKAHGQTADCNTVGRDFECISHGAESFDLLPYWELHTKHPFTGYGLDFKATSPKHWTRVTVEFYLNNGKVAHACFEVARIDGRAKMRKPCTLPEGK